MNGYCCDYTNRVSLNQTDTSIYSPNYALVFRFENEFNKDANRRLMEQNWHKVFYVIAAYLGFIYFGQKFMRNQQAWNLRRELATWNTAVAIFSIMGTYRTITELVYVMKNFGFTFSVCSSSYIEVTKVTGLWTWLFALSKIAELIDTVFIILRKKKLLFVHWYHHSTVLLFCFYAYKEHASSARWLITMNYLAHSFMYSYFALKSLGVKVPAYVNMTITTLEIFQMIIFCVVCIWAYLVKYGGTNCQVSEITLFYAFVLALSYFFLFSNYFYKMYVVPKLDHVKMIKEKDK